MKKKLAIALSLAMVVTMALTVFTFVMICSSFVAVMIAKDQFRLDYTAMGLYYAAIAISAVYGALRNFFNQKSFTANSLIALLILIPVLAAVFYFVRISGYHSHDMIDPEEFIEAKHLIPALLLLFPAVWTMGAITAALSTRLELVSNLTICTVIFMLGLVSKYFVTQWLGTGLLADFVRTLLPNWQYFWMADALASRQVIPFTYLLWALVYVFFYIGFWTLWAMALFNEREIAKDSR